MRHSNIPPWCFSKWNSRSNNIKNLVNIHWLILSYILLFPFFLHLSIVLTVINTCWACAVELHVGQINPGTFCAPQTSHSSEVSGWSTESSSSMSDSLSASQSSLVSFGLSKSHFQWSHFSVSEMHSGSLSSSLAAGWRWILRVWRTFNTWVCPAGRSFADKDGSIDDLSDNLNATAISCWKSDQDTLTISSVSEMYSTAVIVCFSCDIPSQ